MVTHRRPGDRALPFGQTGASQSFCVEVLVGQAYHRRAFEGAFDAETWFKLQQARQDAGGLLATPQLTECCQVSLISRAEAWIEFDCPSSHDDRIFELTS